MKSSLLYRVVLICSLQLFVLLKSGSQSSFALHDSINHLLQNWKNTQGPAISIAVVKNGTVEYKQQSGLANIDSSVSNDSATRFWIASVTKQFTAAAVYKLVVDGKISLNSPVTNYLPDLPVVFKGITVDNLIHHTSGSRDGFVLTALSKKPEAAFTNENVIRYLKAQKHLNFIPGTDFEYNNSGYVLLAEIIERVSGQSYSTFLKLNFFDPLEMSSTFVSGNFPGQPNIAEGYHAVDNNRFEKGHFQGNTYGSTGILTTLNDLVRWQQFLQTPGNYPTLSPVTKLLLKQGLLKTGKTISYAGGLELFSYNGIPVYEHFGADEGFKANMLYFPGYQLSLIGLTNNGSYYDLQKLLYHISGLLIAKKDATNTAALPTIQFDSVAYFYDKVSPGFLKVDYINEGVKIGATPEGYAAPYRIVKDTLISDDPVETKYVLKQKNILQRFDPYYHQNTRYERITLPGKETNFNTYAGEYYSKEIDASYKIMQENSALQFEFVPGVSFNLFAINKTDFMFEYQGANFIRFTKEGFDFYREGCKKLSFVKRQ